MVHALLVALSPANAALVQASLEDLEWTWGSLAAFDRPSSNAWAIILERASDGSEVLVLEQIAAIRDAAPVSAIILIVHDTPTVSLRAAVDDIVFAPFSKETIVDTLAKVLLKRGLS